MKVICAPDSFKGSLDAVAAADAMAAGVRAAIDRVCVDACPIGDGGEGTLRALLAALDGVAIPASVTGMLITKVQAVTGRFAGNEFAYVESAEAVGMQTVPSAERDIMSASSFGVGELMLSACEGKQRRLLVGLGGSATNDGGCGMAQALGIRFFDAADQLIDAPMGGGALQHVHRIDIADRTQALDDVEVVALCDVTNPLTGADGASAVFGPQKGASPADVRVLDAGLARLADIMRRDLGVDVSRLEGAGAAGGLGAGLVAFAGATIVSGIDTVLETIGFDARLHGADLCLTGEGRIDGQSLSGKACLGVAGAATKAGVPVVALVGAAGAGAERCLEAGLTDYVVIGEGLDEAESMQRAAALLADSAARVAKQYRNNDATMDDRKSG